ncbi:hypothetical protein WJX73_003883 [Symbiochloris irregularis]|uniref:Protein kinase domain-containing protein n=1 Tax=Symbiochloris irregularis TaxID=706552 RepID=A0AAW1PLK6_9CHLO
MIILPLKPVTLKKRAETACAPHPQKFTPGSSGKASHHNRIPALYGTTETKRKDQSQIGRHLSSGSDRSNDENMAMHLSQQHQADTIKAKHRQQPSISESKRKGFEVLQNGASPNAQAYHNGVAKAFDRTWTPRTERLDLDTHANRQQSDDIVPRGHENHVMITPKAFEQGGPRGQLEGASRPPRPPTSGGPADLWGRLVHEASNTIIEPPPRHSDSASTSSGEDTCTANSTRPASRPCVAQSQSSVQQSQNSVLGTESLKHKRPLPEAVGVQPAVAAVMSSTPIKESSPVPPAVKQKLQAVSTESSNADSSSPSWAHEVPGFDVKQVIGVGGFCKVRMGVELATGRQVALKIVEKSQAAQAEQNLNWKVGREIAILRGLKHPRINQLIDVIDTPDRMLMVLCHVSGGSLLDRVRTNKRLPEAESAQLLVQAAEGLLYCHSHQRVHRDIKLENLLIDEKGEIQIIDFGLAANWTPGKYLRMHCGSPSYAAPEIVARKLYDGPPVDVWSLGVVLYAMLCGRLPFSAPKSNKQELCAKILRGTYNVPDYMSLEARDLVSGMLTLDPAQRITLPQVLKHPWVMHNSLHFCQPYPHQRGLAVSGQATPRTAR